MKSLIERKSITISPSAHAKIQNFRAFVISEGGDLDYTGSVNLLTEAGFNSVRASGLDTEVLERLGEVAGLDKSRGESLGRAWKNWLATHPVGGRTEETEKTLKGPAQPKSSERPAPLKAMCFKCGASVEMTGAHEVTWKKGRKGVEGTCPICGSRISKAGPLR